VRRLVLVTLFASIACYRPEARDCAVVCGSRDSCPDGAFCSNGRCTTGPACALPVAASCLACLPEEQSVVRCDGDNVVRCDQGAWAAELTCAGAQPVCFAGSCTACQPGRTRCNETARVETCDEHGRWLETQTGETCSAASTAGLITTGWTHTCALFAGAVRCWGGNDEGELGLEDKESRGLDRASLGDALPFVELGSNARVVQIAAGGRHTCALLDSGQVKCWGDNEVGQLGLGDTNPRGDEPGEMNDALRAVDLGAGRTATAIGAGGRHSCAVLDDGGVKCWGWNNAGQLGVGDNRNRGDEPCEMGELLPRVDLGGRRAVAVVVGGFHSCALLDDGNVACWGTNTAGELGLGDKANRGDRPEAPPAIVDLVAGPDTITDPVVALAAGHRHTCARFAGGAMRCWGANDSGELGLGDKTDRFDASALVELPIDDAVAAIAAGVSHTCALLAGGRVKCWGLDTFGQLGLGADPDDQVGGNWGDDAGESLAALPDVDLGSRDGGGRQPLRARALACGGDHTCALLDTGRIKCWGENAYGQLGLGQPGHRGDDAGEMGDNLPEAQIPGVVEDF